MIQILRRLFVLTGLCAFASLTAFAGTLTVTSPEDGAFVGANTTISFRIEGGNVQVTVRAQIVKVGGGASTTLETRVTPDESGNASGSLSWNPSDSFPEGDYDITVTATEPGNTYNVVTLTVTLDRIKPRFSDFSPLQNSFVRGVVTITAEIDEANIKEWRVTVDDADLPNNTGNTASVSVTWDTSFIEEDGAKTIKIKVTDKADNEDTLEIPVTVDRAAPTVSVLFPRSNAVIRPGSVSAVIVKITDGGPDSVDWLAVLVEMRRMDDTVIRRVYRLRWTGGNPSEWLGRLPVYFTDPDEFKITVRVVDRAGNVAPVQEVPLTTGRSRYRAPRYPWRR
ncbi:MAG: hypothetical protein KatS3mg015_0401 [Fimbriimonadales bacterium]|nr:MAG: hypothetical protein KatS3mg015_0401 [Fimbriimonadales bacterium]